MVFVFVLVIVFVFVMVIVFVLVFVFVLVVINNFTPKILLFQNKVVYLQRISAYPNAGVHGFVFCRQANDRSRNY